MTLARALENIQAMTAFRLANEVDCGCPDTDESAGADLLRSVRDSFVDAVENDPATWLTEDDWADAVHEIADGAPSIYTHRKWLEFVDLTAYNEDLDDLGGTSGDMERDAGVALYIIADRLVHRLHEMLMDDDELENADDDDADDDDDDDEDEDEDAEDMAATI